MKTLTAFKAALHRHLRVAALVLIGIGFAHTASAQWQWVDKDGKKVFSDRSPPPDIPEASILKRPGGNSRAPAPVVTPVAAAAPGAPAVGASGAKPAVPAASAPKLSGKDAELEARKKKADEEVAAKKKAEEEKNAKIKAENCDRAKSGLATIKSGIRIAQTGANGEREILDDAKRDQEAKRVQEIADANCK